MQKIFFVKNGELEAVNDWLERGWKVKTIQAVSESVGAYGYQEGVNQNDYLTNVVGDIYAYIVLDDRFEY